MKGDHSNVDWFFYTVVASDKISHAISSMLTVSTSTFFKLLLIQREIIHFVPTILAIYFTYLSVFALLH